MRDKKWIADMRHTSWIGLRTDDYVTLSTECAIVRWRQGDNHRHRLLSRAKRVRVIFHDTHQGQVRHNDSGVHDSVDNFDFRDCSVHEHRGRCSGFRRDVRRNVRFDACRFV
jgi:hypothetical protein